MIDNTPKEGNSVFKIIKNTFSANKPRDNKENDADAYHNQSVRRTNRTIVFVTSITFAATVIFNFVQFRTTSKQIEGSNEQLAVFRKQVSYDSIQAVYYQKSVIISDSNFTNNRRDFIHAAIIQDSTLRIQIRDSKVRDKAMNDSRMDEEAIFQIENEPSIQIYTGNISINNRKSLLFRTKYSNTGKTQAINIQASFMIKVLDSAEHRNFTPILKRDTNTKCTANFMAILDGSDEIPFDINDTTAILKTQTKQIYIYGAVWFDDVFGQHLVTNFSAMFNPTYLGRESNCQYIGDNSEGHYKK